MKLGMMLPAKRDIQWELAAQLGVRFAVTKAAPELSGLCDPSDFASLKQVRDNFRAAGLTLYALEGDEFDMSRIKLGLPGRDEDIEKYRAMLRNMGKLGISLICYNFMGGVGWYRTDTALAERGGALASGFDIRHAEKRELQITQEQMWKNYQYFLDAVLPAAEEAGVKMGLHPDDPPIPELLGYSRIFTSADAYRKAMSLSDSPSHGITFCQATFRMMGEDVFSLMKEFREKIFFLHFRDAEGSADCFRETFHDNGPTDMAALMCAAAKYIPDCLVRPDHTPSMAGEGTENTGYTMLGNLFAIGYMRGLAEGAGIDLT